MRKLMKYGKAYGGSDPELLEGESLNQMINRRLVRTRNTRRSSVEIKNSVDIIRYLVDIREN